MPQHLPWPRGGVLQLLPSTLEIFTGVSEFRVTASVEGAPVELVTQLQKERAEMRVAVQQLLDRGVSGPVEATHARQTWDRSSAVDRLGLEAGAAAVAVDAEKAPPPGSVLVEGAAKRPRQTASLGDSDESDENNDMSVAVARGDWMFEFRLYG